MITRALKIKAGLEVSNVPLHLALALNTQSGFDSTNIYNCCEIVQQMGDTCSIRVVDETIEMTLSYSLITLVLGPLYTCQWSILAITIL